MNCEMCQADKVRHDNSLLCNSCFEGLARMFWLHLNLPILRIRLCGITQVALTNLNNHPKYVSKGASA